MLNCAPPFPSTRLVSFPSNQYTTSAAFASPFFFCRGKAMFPLQLDADEYSERSETHNLNKDKANE